MCDGMILTDRVERDRRTTGEGRKHLKGAQKLASRLQRTVNTGRANRSQMREVDKFMSQHLSSEISSILETLDSHISNLPSLASKEKLSELFSKSTQILDQIKNMEFEGYQNLVGQTRRTNPVILDKLINVDTDISTLLLTLRADVSKLVKSEKLIATEYQKMSGGLDEAIRTLEGRRNSLFEPA